MWYTKGINACLKDLDTDSKNGLIEEEVIERQKKYGLNSIDDSGEKEGIIKKLLRQLNDFLVIILISASVVSFAVSFIKGDGDYIDSVIILVIVALNAVLGVIQEDRAEKAIEELKKLTVNKAGVIRNGRKVFVDAQKIVPGDIMVFEAGDIICADGRLVETEGLMCEESSITGESIPSEKNENMLSSVSSSIGDRKNMVYSSSAVTSGRGKAVVTATGMDTEVGKIASMIKDSGNEKTPLQDKLDKTGKVLGAGAIAICIIIFIMGIIRGSDPFDMFMTSVSLAVAAIPEGLLAIVTIVLAIGMQRMSKKKAVIRRLPVVETLGCADVICSDKTGTLTKNEMKVVKCFGFSKNADVEILKTCALCNNTVYDGNTFKGEATEKALFEAAYNKGVVSDIEKEGYSRIYEIPFNSERKFMTVVHRKGSGKYITSVKGAFDVLINKCDAVLVNGKTVPVDENYKKRLAEENRDMAKKALRVLGVAMKETKEMPDKSEAEKGLTLVGLAGLMDPPREEAKESVALCKKAGILPVMITGDHILTALAVAGELGIYRENDLYLTGNEIEDMTDDELKKSVPFCTVFARVSPLHKLRIVEAYKNNGSIVAMTGDGVNDAPALKAAHIGCAMGLNGTDVAKGAADMVIMDDNFATIVEAVREGRGIYRNIKKAVHFLVSSNIGEVITIFAAMLFGWSVPLLPIQLLWVNLVTDALPAIALSFEKTDDDIMTIPPLKTETSMFSNGQGFKIALEGIMIGMLALIAFGTGHIYFDGPYEHITGRTMAFAVLSISQLVHVFNVRSERSIFKTGAGGNSLLVIAFVIGIIMQVSVITIPLFASLFGVTVLGFNEWLIVALLSLSPIFVVEMEKLVLKMGDS